MAIEPSCEIEFEQCQLHLAGRRARLSNNFIDRDRRRPEQRGDPVAQIRIGFVEFAGVRVVGRGGAGDTALADRASASITSAAFWISVAPSRIS